MLTIHVGLHKTGSTSIQAALGLVDHRQDLLVVPMGPLSRWSDGEFTRRLVEASRSRHVIVSDENMLGGMLEVYQPASERLRGIRAALDGADYDIVLYVRPQTSWLASVYLQHVQQGGTLTGSDFLEEAHQRPLLAWRALCAIAARESGARRVLVRAHIPGRDVVSDFFTACGLGRPPAPTPGGIRINASISAAQAPILLALNDDPTVSPAERLQMRRLFQGTLTLPDSRWSPFLQQDQDNIVRRFRSDWMALADMLDDVDPPEARVFRESAALWDLPSLPHAGSSVSDPAVLAELLRCVRLLASMSETPARGTLRRALEKTKESPGDIPRALNRALRRWF